MLLGRQLLVQFLRTGDISFSLQHLDICHDEVIIIPCLGKVVAKRRANLVRFEFGFKGLPFQGRPMFVEGLVTLI